MDMILPSTESLLNAVFFEDSLKTGKPYISSGPRNHESLFFVTKGSLLYECGGIKEVVPEGHTGYIKKSANDKSSAFNCDEVFYMAVNFSFGEEKCELPFATDASASLRLDGLFSEALAAFRSAGKGRKAVTGGLLLEIIGALYDEYEKNTQEKGAFAKIEHAINYLKENYADPELKISRLSEISAMSERQFRRIFFSLYGKNPYAFLLDYRIDKAKTMVYYTSKSISSIAYECGFSDVYGFSRSFRAHTGLSPKNYREK